MNMGPVLYIDIFFLVNWMMDSALLFVTGRMLKRRIRPARLSVAAAAGALWACLCAAASFYGRGMYVLTLGPAAALMVWMAYPSKGGRQLLRSWLHLYLAAVILGGTLHLALESTAFGHFLRLWLTGSKRGAVSVWLLALAAGGWMAAAECALRLREAGRSREMIWDVTLYYRGRQLTVAALWDSGNQLCDPFTGRAVHILELSACRDLLGEEACQRIAALARGRPAEPGTGPASVRLIPCRSLGNAHGLLPVMELDRMTGVHTERTESPLVGFCLTSLSSDASYRMLLHSQADKKRRNPDDH
ncbi:MAG: sigma-E processing peptidase SpoIIGA [Lachnospiraceae bacterium]|nr:sigma-E processing peptidase SpoIIGA [Lachnospiraceae bacterium]